MKNHDEFKDELLSRKEQHIAARRHRRARILTGCVSLLLCIAVLTAALLPGSNPVIPSVQAADLMASIQAGHVTGKTADDAFTTSQMDFAVKLFQSCYGEDTEKNTLVSPLSVMLALAMTANGADGQTKAEMEAVLGMPIEELNRYLYSYVNSLPATENAKVGIANSVWYRDQENRLQVKESFLQRNADYYNASAYKAPFDDTTLEDINNWVNSKTDGMIDKILDQISADAVMYLINALVFDAKWESPYKDDTMIYEGTFTSRTGEKQDVTMMHGRERTYLCDDKATGFAKYYSGGNYAFVAMLPNEGVSVEEYVSTLTAQRIRQTLEQATFTSVHATIPQFSYDYDTHLNGILEALGMPTAFNSSTADFSKMATSSYGNIFIGDVLHKTHITVDTQGTRAAAVTKVEMWDESAEMYDYYIKLDRPFVYMIIDTQTNLPLFMGTVMSVEN